MLYLVTLVTSNNFNVIDTDVDGKHGTERTNDYKLTNKFVISGLHPDHLGLIIGIKGKNIKRFEHEFGCSIKLCKEDGDVVSASVETPWSKKDALPRLMASLSLAGRSIAAKRLQHNRRVRGKIPLLICHQCNTSTKNTFGSLILRLTYFILWSEM